MSTKNQIATAAVLALRVALTMVIMVFAFILSAMISRTTAAGLSADEAALTANVLLYVSAVNALILSYLALRSRWHGWKLTLALFTAQFGIETLMPQIETVVFNGALQLSAQQITSIFMAGLLRALFFAPLAVVALGKWRAHSAPDASTLMQLSLAQWLNRLSQVAGLYVLVYFFFGYFVAWQSPALRLYYSGSADIQPFINHMVQVIRSDGAMVIIQLLRGYLWALIALPILLSLRGRFVESAFALGISYAVLLSDFILFPNPYMPYDVRMAHFTELWSSMLVFGLISSWLIMRPSQTWKLALSSHRGREQSS